jgi:hypothetical protein
MPMSGPKGRSHADFDDVLVEGRDCVAARLGLLMSLYFRGPAGPEWRARLGGLLNDYLALAAGNLRWWFTGERGPWRDLREGPAPDVAAQIAAMDPDDEFDFMAHSGDSPDDAGHFFAVALSLSPVMYQYHPRDLGFVSIGLPVSWTRNEPAAFRDLVLAWCRGLSPFHGYAGLGVLLNPEYGEARAAEPFVFPLVQRYPGLEFDQPVNHSLGCRDGIKGVNWLTVVSDGLLSGVGGGAAVREALGGGNVRFSDYPGGLVLQAGQVPELGDADLGLIPAEYQKVARFLKPIRSQEDDTIIVETPPGVDRRAFAKQWFARFD